MVDSAVGPASFAGAKRDDGKRAGVVKRAPGERVEDISMNVETTSITEN